jgi:hypothetical protein
MAASTLHLISCRLRSRCWQLYATPGTVYDHPAVTDQQLALSEVEGSPFSSLSKLRNSVSEFSLQNNFF